MAHSCNEKSIRAIGKFALRNPAKTLCLGSLCSDSLSKNELKLLKCTVTISFWTQIKEIWIIAEIWFVIIWFLFLIEIWPLYIDNEPERSPDWFTWISLSAVASSNFHHLCLASRHVSYEAFLILGFWPYGFPVTIEMNEGYSVLRMQMDFMIDSGYYWIKFDFGFSLKFKLRLCIV